MFVADTLYFSKDRKTAHVRDAEYNTYSAPCCPKKAAKSIDGNYKSDREIIAKVMKHHGIKEWKMYKRQ